MRQDCCSRARLTPPPHMGAMPIITHGQFFHTHTHPPHTHTPFPPIWGLHMHFTRAPKHCTHAYTWHLSTALAHLQVQALSAPDPATAQRHTWHKASQSRSHLELHALHFAVLSASIGVSQHPAQGRTLCARSRTTCTCYHLHLKATLPVFVHMCRPPPSPLSAFGRGSL